MGPRASHHCFSAPAIENEKITWILPRTVDMCEWLVCE